MKTDKHIGYNWRFYKIIKQFTEDERLDILTACLNDLEEDIKERFGYSEEKTMWFRLFPGDTLVTDIHSIISDYNSSERNFLLRSLRQCYRNAEVEIKFS